MNVLVVSSYPDALRPHNSIFVYHLVQQLAALNVTIEVISPISWWKRRGAWRNRAGDYPYGAEGATILRPKYFDFPNRVRIGRHSLGRLNRVTYARSVRRMLNHLKHKPDIVYAHFLYRAGPGALMAARCLGVPAVVALGESDLSKHERIYTRAHVQRTVNQFAGIVSVSAVNKRYCVNALGVPEDRIVVLPNAVNKDIYFPRDKVSMRRKYGFPRHGYIVAFIGHFIERKGPLRVASALDRLPDDVFGVYIGEGPQQPEGKKVLFRGSVPPHQVPELLSASDVFVLPTLNEGSSNAIAEAIACGLPVVSSNIEAVREQVDAERGVLIDPTSIDDIVRAIEEVLYHRGSDRLSQGGIQGGGVMDLEDRAIAIKEFLAQHIGKLN